MSRRLSGGARGDTPVMADDAGEVVLRRVRGWVVGRSKDADFAVSRRCRHQFADLSNGHVDAEGCLVCPWHQSRYDVTDGRMVSGPHGMLGWHGPTPGYTQLVKAFGRVVRLRVGQVRRHGDRVDVQ